MSKLSSSYYAPLQDPTAVIPPPDLSWNSIKQTTWAQLAQLTQSFKQQTLNDLFTKDPDRANRYRLSAGPLTLDYSKNWLTDDVLKALSALLQQSHFDELKQDLIANRPINFTEQQPANHISLRSIPDALLQSRVDLIHSGHCRGSTGQAFKTFVNIGIGGSDLGPRVLISALEPYQHPSIRIRFVSNIDPSDFETTIADLDPHTTAFIICSKSFTTQETLHNAQKARAWLLQALNELSQNDAAHHLFAVTATPEKAQAFGIPPDHILPFSSWVGGRYSIWSSVGFSVALATSVATFEDFKAGGHHMDQHFLSAEVNQEGIIQNMPALMAVISLWYNHFFQAQSSAIIPYSAQLKHLPRYLQQLVMESNGKSTNRANETLTIDSSPIIWGGVGTDCQHSFHQLLHQGTRLCPIDFLLPMHNHYGSAHDHQYVIANCLAQAHTLMSGTPLAERHSPDLDIHKKMAGNRPSNLLVFDKITPQVMGALIALYEHKTFIESIIWEINAFDQWGVELGKKISRSIQQALLPPSPPSEAPKKATTGTESDVSVSFDKSTLYWIDYYQSLHKAKH